MLFSVLPSGLVNIAALVSPQTRLARLAHGPRSVSARWLVEEHSNSNAAESTHATLNEEVADSHPYRPDPADENASVFLASLTPNEKEDMDSLFGQIHVARRKRDYETSDRLIEEIQQ